MPSPEYVAVPGGLPDLVAVTPVEAALLAENAFGLDILACEQCGAPCESAFCPDCLDLLNGYRPGAGRRGRQGIGSGDEPAPLPGADPMELD